MLLAWTFTGPGHAVIFIASVFCIDATLSPSPRGEPSDIDGVRFGLIAGAIRMEIVTGGSPVVLLGTNCGQIPPVAGSKVAASKSSTPSNRWLLRMKLLISTRFASPAGVP